MMEKLAQPGEGGGCTPTPLHYLYHHIQSCGVYAPAERADALPLFLLYTYMYSVVQTEPKSRTHYTARHTMYLYKLKLYELKGEYNVGSYPCSAVCMMSSCGGGIKHL
jgi:hypothetical protein